VLTNFCRSIWFLFLITSVPAYALENRQYWSTELLPSPVLTQEAAIPLTFGIQWNGNSPRSENEDRLFSLASVKKIITAATALRELGPEFRFRNEFRADHDEALETIYNPIFAVSGDPTWGHESYGENLRTRVSKIVAELKKNKIRKVVGEISFELLKSSLGNYGRPAGWKPHWQTACYAGLITPVILSGNCAQMAVYPNRRAVWITEGVSTPIENQLTASGADNLSVTPVLDTLGRVNRYVLKGSVSRPGSVFLPVHSNEAWLKNIFIAELRQSGIAYFPKASPWIRHGEMKPMVVDLSSVTLREMIVPFLQSSINIVGERLHFEAPTDLITLASVLSDESDYRNVTLVDGSGLMAANRITPKTFYKFLSGLMTQPYFADLHAGLPVSGESGTLRMRMDSEFLKGKVHAKTGTIDLVSNLAGYWVKADQSLEPFVIFTESSLSATDARKKIDSIVDEFGRKN
jgi:D-alanyl-D-alanine carboxypeptidase/D-alanyl-D-alanine-endopeptidase (penicillin-binding protein 4)